MPPELFGPPSAPVIVGHSPALLRVVSLATRAADTAAKVLITGESGVGKDVIARFIHARSPRARGPLVALNCAGLTESLLESELFGHVKGSFTGAYRDKVGCLEQGDGGTVFLDEIGDMGLRMQGLLLRFLETGELRRVGADARPTRVNVRVISATNKDLYAMVSSGSFRDDLFYRINVLPIHVPPLRERVEDIAPLVAYFTKRCDASPQFRAAAFQLLETYRWPGNVRELQNVIEQLASLVSGRPIEVDDLPPAIAAGGRPRSAAQSERRRPLAEDLYEGLASKRIRFWEDIYPLFMDRDITRADLRQLIRRGLASSSGSYRGLLDLFGMPRDDYKRLLNVLATHGCTIDSRDFRPGRSAKGASELLPARTASAGARFPA